MGQFNDYTLANSIDPVNDLLLIYNNASGTLENISRNTFLALSSQPLGLTDSQSPTNKTFNNTNSFTIKDGSLTLQNSTTTTKQAVFSLSSITAGQTRTITIPDASGTLALLGSNNSFTGTNSFTGSSWSGGTISNTSIASDTITGYTTSTSGNIYGIAVTSGVITGASTVGANALATNAVQANQLATTAISLGYAQITTTFTTSATSATQVTGLAATVTIPAGGRKVKITVYSGAVSTSTAAATAAVTIWDGTVGSGTQLQLAQVSQISAGAGIPVIGIAIVTPAAGSKTYNVGLSTSNGSDAANMGAAATAPAFILVETI